MVKGKTKSGIEFAIDERIKDDVRMYGYMTEMSNGTDEEKGIAYLDMMKLIFGGREGLMAFQNAVANAHDGVCSADVLKEEFSEIIEAINLKK